MALYAHNVITYQKVLQMLNTHKRCALIQATGTGKSFIMQELLDTLFKNMSVICVVPTLSIAQSIQLYPDWDYPNVEFTTYEELKKNTATYDVVILDELHRSGARTWKPAVEKEMQECKYCLGLTATPWRYLDNKRDMAHELFGEHIVYGPDIEQGIEQGILCGFDYVAILSDVAEYVEKIESLNPSKEIQIRMSGLELSEYTLGERIKKHIGDISRKWIVFYSDTRSLENSDTDLESWFGRIPTYSIYSNQSKEESKRNLLEFNNCTGTCIIKAVDMLNEGIHLDGVTGIIFARKTVSGNVFLQQLGRALSASNKTTRPLIIDLVENYRNIKVLKAGIPTSKVVSKGPKPDVNTIHMSQVLISYDDVLLELEDILASTKDKWASTEDTILKEYYALEGLEVYKRLESKTKEECSKRVKYLGLTRNKKWSPEEDAIITKHFLQEKKDIWKRLPGRTLSSINRRADKLGLIPKWLPEEDLLLMRRWKTEGLALHVELSRHTLAEITEHAKKLGLGGDVV